MMLVGLVEAKQEIYIVKSPFPPKGPILAILKRQEVDDIRQKTIVDADDIALLVNTPAQAKSLLHSLGQAAGSIGIHVNANKMQYMCFNQEGAIFTLNGNPLKLED